MIDRPSVLPAARRAAGIRVGRRARTAALVAAGFAAALAPLAAVAGSRPTPGPDCADCAHYEAPADLSSTMVIPAAVWHGEPLVVEGTIFEADGRTPAAGVLLYAYHTNPAGIYPRPAGAGGMARWHGALRGWLRTACDGRYRIETIRPGRYPDGGIPAHIHMTVMPKGGPEYFIDELVFTDDDLVNARFRAEARDIGGSGIVTPTRDASKTWRVQRDIVLPAEPPER